MALNTLHIYKLRTWYLNKQTNKLDFVPFPEYWTNIWITSAGCGSVPNISHIVCPMWPWSQVVIARCICSEMFYYFKFFNQRRKNLQKEMRRSSSVRQRFNEQHSFTLLSSGALYPGQDHSQVLLNKVHTSSSVAMFMFIYSVETSHVSLLSVNEGRMYSRWWVMNTCSWSFINIIIIIYT